MDILPKSIFYIKCSEEEKSAFLVNQNKASKASITKKELYQQRLNIWKTENEDQTKLNLEDFFKNEEFDFYEVTNEIGINLFEKCKIFFERNGTINIGKSAEKMSCLETNLSLNARNYEELENQKKKKAIFEKLEEIDRKLLRREIEMKNEYLKNGKPEMIKF